MLPNINYAVVAASGAKGGSATAAVKATTTSATELASATAHTVGGRGGNGNGVGAFGGTGGVAGPTTATASGFSAYASAIETGGAGGAGTNGAKGGAGAAADLTNEVSGSTKGGTLTLRQHATGGYGGSGNGTTGGVGGSANSTLTFNDVTANAIHATNVTGNSIAYGGTGGNGTVAGAGGKATGSTAMTGGQTTVSYTRVRGGTGGGTGGGVGGSATSSAAATSLSEGGHFAATARARTYGGRGGIADGVTGGAGGVASGTTASASGYQAYAYARQTGGYGGNGQNGGGGGAGASSTLTNAVTGSTGGGELALIQNVRGGSGGYSTGGAGGSAGAAQSSLTFDDIAANAIDSSRVVGRSTAYGGTGGNGGNGGNGGAAIASVNMTGAKQVYATGRALGGNAGASYVSGNSGGSGNTATASATATSTSVTFSLSRASAYATGGVGGRATGAGKVGGTGGVAAVVTANAIGYSAEAIAAQAGGAGGLGQGGATGGAGAASTVTNVVDGETKGGTLRFTQNAAGGAGGSSDTATGGAGGSATSSLTFDDISANAIDASILSGYVTATGGIGGNGGLGAKGGAASSAITLTATKSVNASATASGGGSGASTYPGSKANSGISGGGSTASSAANSTTGNATAGASTYGGTGGQGAGTGKVGGAGGIASGTTATASGQSAYARVRQQGGIGGAGRYGANGGAGAASTLVDATKGSTLGGSLQFSQYVLAGSGGHAYGGGSGGAGGAASSSFTFNDITANVVAASNLTALVRADAGAAGRGVTGIKGGAATAAVALTGANTVSATSRTKGGRGGLTDAGAATVAGTGGSATASASASSTSGNANAYATSTAGAGGASNDAAIAGGAGGVASGTTATANGRAAYVSVQQTGGAGGGGGSKASGGTGAASSLTNAVSGTTTGGNLRLTQTATGGAGGYGYKGAGGAAGAGTSSLTFSDLANATRASYFNGNSIARGGSGGSGSVAGKSGAASASIAITGANAVLANSRAYAGGGGAVNAYGSSGNGATGETATASTSSTTISATDRGYGRAAAFGGTGGQGRGAGNAGGAGGSAAASAVSNGRSASAVIYSTGGGGGYGSYGASGGAGGSVAIYNKATGVTTGGYLNLIQRVTAGAGGNSNTGAGGAGGNAVSQNTFDDVVANAIDAGNTYGRTQAYGGAGGNGATAGKAGTGKSTVGMTGMNSVFTVANARGGIAGRAAGSYTTAGGAATAASGAYAKGLDAGDIATANATGTGGAGTTQGAATVGANASTANGQTAQATATASGGSGSAQATAKAAGTGGTPDVTAIAKSQVGSKATSQTVAVRGASSIIANTGGYNSFGSGISIPNANLVASELTDESNVAAVLGTAKANVFGAGFQEARYSSDASGNRTYTSTVTWDFDSTTSSGNLYAGLLDNQALGAGFDTLTFSIAIEGVTVVTKSFATLTSAQTFFDNKALDLGTVASNKALTIDVNCTLVSNDIGAGFGFDYLLGVTNDGVDNTPPAAPSLPDLVASSDAGASNTDNVTNVTSPFFTGSAEANATVRLYDLATEIGSAKADGGGLWTIQATPLVSGVHSILATATDASGNVSTKSAALSVTIDVAPPAAPSVPNMSAASDSNNTTDDITNVTTPTFIGTAEAGATVTLFSGGTSVGSAKATAGGNWTIKTSTLSSFSQQITATATDLAGNISNASAALTVVIDTVGVAPSTPDLDAASDGGESNTDNITTFAAPTLNGTGEAGATIRLFDGVTQVGTTTANAKGEWSIKTGVLAEGVHAFTANLTDIAGNNSASSGLLSVTIDTTAPGAPTALDLTAATDTGSSDTDNITKLTAPIITGKAEADSTVVLQSGATQIGSTKAAADGTWSISTSKLADGVYSLFARAIDVAGNIGAPSVAMSVTIDTATPTPSTPDMTGASDSGVSDTDDITNDSTPTFGGTAEIGATVTLFDGLTEVGSGVADKSGLWSIDSKLLTNGVHAITAQSKDIAGNTSSVSGALSVTIDTKSPAAPTTPDLAEASDSGASKTDNLTNAKTPVFNGLAEANSTVNLFDGATLIGSAVADGSGAWSITASTLADGVRSITAKASDIAGNNGVASAALSVTIDTTIAAPTALDLATASDSGASSTDNITKDTTPIISGKADANVSVKVFDGAVEIGSATANGAGSWSITSPVLAQGVHSITAQATDAAGNVSAASTVLAITIDTTAPGLPTVPNMTPTTDSGASNSDDITNNPTPTFVGTAEANATVALFEGAVSLGTAKASGTGAWSIVSGTLSEGKHTLTARATDVAGNLGKFSTGLTVTIDTIAPTVAIGKVTTTSIAGTAEAGAKIDLNDGATKIGTVTADLVGQWAAPAALTPGLHTLTAVATDIAGNATTTPGLPVNMGTVGNDLLFGGGIASMLVGGASDAILAAVGYTLPALSEIEFLSAYTGSTGLALTGNEFVNAIVGGAGNDTVSGGGAADILFGGAGVDVFGFAALSDSAVAAPDLLADFSALAGEQIDLNLLDANTGLEGNQAFSFIGSSAFSGVAGQLRQETAGTNTMVFGDVNGDSVADFGIALNGVQSLNNTNFVL